MDFLKSAVASAISKGPAFPYSFGERVDIDQSIWTLQNGTRRVSIFTYQPPVFITLTCWNPGGWVEMQHLLFRY